MAAGLGASVKLAGDFEQTMSGVKAVSGATGAEMAQLSGLALQLGKDTSFSAREAAAGIEELVKGGLTIPDIMNGAAKSTLALAAAGGVSLPEAAEIASNAMSIFNLKGSDMAMVADQIAGAANASSLSVTDFRMSLAAGGSVLASAGQSFEQTATAIALMGAAGIKGSDAGTSLKSMFNNLIPTTDKATAAMEKVGLWTKNAGSAFVNANGSFKDASEIAGLLHDKLGGLTEAQRSLALEAIFGADGMRAGIVLTKAGAEGYDKMAQAMGKVTAESVGAERLNNWKGSLEQLKGSLETAAITLGLSLLPALKGLADGATGAVNAAIPLIEAWGPKLAGGLGGALRMLPDIGKAIQQAVGFFLTGAGDIEMFRGVLNKLLGPQGAQMAIVVFTNLSGFFRETLMPAFVKLGEVVTKVLGGDFGGALRALGGLLADFAPMLMATLADWGTRFVEWVAPLIPPLLAEAGKLGGELLGWIAGQIPPLLEKLATWAAAFVEWVGPKIPPLLEELGKLGNRLFHWIVEIALPQVLAKLGEWGLAFVSWVGPKIPAMLLELAILQGKLLAWIVTDALPTIITELIKWGGAFVAWVGEHVLPKLPGELAKVGGALTTWLNDTSDTIAAKLNEIGNLIWQKIAGDNDSFKTIMVGAFGGAIRAAGDAIERAKDLILAPLRSIVDKAKELIDKIKDLIDRAKRLWDNRPKPGDGDGGSEARAMGGPVYAGRSYVVGERGPELFMPRADGMIIPNGAGGGLTINIYPQGSILTSRDLIDEIHAGLVRKGLSQGGLSFGGGLP